MIYYKISFTATNLPSRQRSAALINQPLLSYVRSSRGYRATGGLVRVNVNSEKMPRVKFVAHGQSVFFFPSLDKAPSVTNGDRTSGHWSSAVPRGSARHPWIDARASYFTAFDIVPCGVCSRWHRRKFSRSVAIVCTWNALFKVGERTNMGRKSSDENSITGTIAPVYHGLARATFIQFT